jgi:nitrate/TMAO reductase-like tetraheme cytochrome c subunit
MNLKRIVIIFLFAFVGMAILFAGYVQWNSANPDKTCASCHEISPKVGEWQNSAHRDVRCTECHGSALSNGLHSLKEKADMVFTHLGEGKKPEDIRMTEKQVLDLSNKCTKCHQSEYKKWLSGGHSANYADIFMNGKHNQAEAPYWACLRCHGMFYDGNIKTLLQKPEKPDGVWKINEMEQAGNQTIPCLSCHSVHHENELQGKASRHDIPKEISYDRPKRNTPLSWYVRDSKLSIRADKLMRIAMFDPEGKQVKVSDDPANKLCIQCHSPNFKHQTGSQDDRTPTGVHEGFSCVACHAPHSNDASNSCKTCHPAISNCGLDVTKMNTTFADKNSPNDIHTVSCNSCHKNVKELRERKFSARPSN